MHQAEQINKKNKISYFSKNAVGLKYLLISMPFVLWFFAFCYVPIFGWLYAFTDYQLGKGVFQMPFTGFDNFVRLWKEREDLFRVLRNTLVLGFMSIACSIFPVIFAIMLNDIGKLRYKKLIQTITTLPNFISWIVVFGLSFAMFSNAGFVMSLMTALKINVNIGTGFMGNNDTIWQFMTGLGVWKTLGWNTIIYLAAIAGIDQEQYDAAKVDGAGKIQTIRHVTLPGLAMTYLVLLLLNISNLLASGFEKYFTFFNSLVSDRIEVLDYYVYKVGIVIGDYSMSVAISMFKSLISVVLLFTVNAIAKRVRGNSIF